MAALALYAATLLPREQAVDTVAGVLRHAFAMSIDSPQTPINEWEYRPWVRGQFQLEHGLWIAMGVLFALGMANVAQATPGRACAHEKPAPIPG